MSIAPIDLQSIRLVYKYFAKSLIYIDLCVFGTPEKRAKRAKTQ